LESGSRRRWKGQRREPRSSMRGAVDPRLRGQTTLGERVVRQARGDVGPEHHLALPAEWRAARE